jgi:uncharacterized protein YpmB
MTKKRKNLIAGVVVIVVAIVIFFVARTERSLAPSSGRSSVGPATSNVIASSSATGTVTPPAAATSSSSTPRISISFDHFYHGGSFTFSYPPSWSILNTRPFSLTNFNGAYGPHGTLPAGGAEIDITTTTAAGGFDNILQTHMMGSSQGVTSTAVVDGTSCVRAQYQESNAGFSTQTVSLYCEQGTELWEIDFVDRVGDPNVTAHLAEFGEVLSTMKFIP